MGQIDRKLIRRRFHRRQVIHIFHPGVKVLEYRVIFFILFFGIGRLQPAQQPHVSGLLRAAGQLPPALGGHLGDKQVLALPAGRAAVVADENNIFQQTGEHIFQRIQGPAAGCGKQDALLCQCTDRWFKVRRQLAVFVQKGSVHIRRDQADAVHFILLAYPM